MQAHLLPEGAPEAEMIAVCRIVHMPHPKLVIIHPSPKLKGTAWLFPCEWYWA